MSDSLETLVAAHLSVWNSPASDDRDRAIAQVYAADLTTNDPEGSYAGHAGVAQAIDGLHEKIAGAQITRSGPIQTAQNLSTFAWGIAPVGGPVIVTGRDILLIDDGKISSIYVVIDAPAG